MNYYDTLGLARTAEPQVIDAAYKAMIRRYHPDVFAGAKEEGERRSKELNEAYQVLRDPVSRARYDETLHHAKPKEPAPEEPEASSDEWEWDSEAFREHGREKTTAIGWKIAGGVFVALFVLAIVQDLSHSEAKAPEPPARAEQSSPAMATTAKPLSAPNTKPADISASVDCLGVTCRVLTPFGWGGIEAGVTTDSAERSSGMKLKDDGSYDGDCRTYVVVGGPANLWLLVENGVVSTLEVNSGAKGPTEFKTDRGVGLGDPESAVRSAYRDLKQLPDIYGVPPDKMLFHYEPGGERGIKFAIKGGKVSSITVGTQSIEYVEGCS